MWTSSIAVTTPTRGDDADSRWRRRLAVTTPTRGDGADSRWPRRLAVDNGKSAEEDAIQRRMIKRNWSWGSRYQWNDVRDLRNMKEWEMNKWKRTEEMNDCKVMNIVIIKEQSTKKKTRTRGETLIDWLWFYFVILFCVDLIFFSLDYDVLSLDYDLLEYLFYSCCYSLSSELVLVQLFNVTCGHCWFL